MFLKENDIFERVEEGETREVEDACCRFFEGRGRILLRAFPKESDLDGMINSVDGSGTRVLEGGSIEGQPHTEEASTRIAKLALPHCSIALSSLRSRTVTLRTAAAALSLELMYIYIAVRAINVYKFRIRLD